MAKVAQFYPLLPYIMLYNKTRDNPPYNYFTHYTVHTHPWWEQFLIHKLHKQKVVFYTVCYTIHVYISQTVADPGVGGLSGHTPNDKN